MSLITHISVDWNVDVTDMSHADAAALDAAALCGETVGYLCWLDKKTKEFISPPAYAVEITCDVCRLLHFAQLAEVK